MILELLRLDEFYGEGKTIEIAKGKHKLPETIKEGMHQLKRQIEWLKK